MISEETRARSTPAGLATIATAGQWKMFRHLAIENRLAQEMQAGTIRRALDFMPPQHGKSWFGSCYVPAWILASNPNIRFLLASYGGEYAASWGGQTRDVVAEAGPKYFGVEVDSGSESKAWWRLSEARGYMASAGVGGQFTGKAGDWFRYDDPVKNAQDAQSPTKRRTAYEFYQSVARTRLSVEARQWGTQTRWHEDDLSGRIMGQARETGEPWLVITLPAIAEEDEDGETIIRDSIGYSMKDEAVRRVVGNWRRKKGEALCPELHPISKLEADREAVGSYFWAALYQQRPRPLGGGIFKQKDFRYYRYDNDRMIVTLDEAGEILKRFDPETLSKFITVDLAVTAKQSSDWTVVSTWAHSPDRDLLLLDRARIRLEGPDQGPLIQQEAARNRVSSIKIEAVAYQLSIVQDLRRKGVPVVAVYPKGDKTARAIYAAGFVEAHKVFWPQSAPWLDEWETELLGFPNAEHDDQVDTFSMAVLQDAEVDDRSVVTW